jgi:EEF1A lysine methyltransferase 2
MDTIVSWTKNLCIKTETDDVSEELSSWNVLDIGTGNGLLLQALAKQGYAILAI